MAEPPESVRVLRKRRPPTERSTDDMTRDPKRAKTDATRKKPAEAVDPDNQIIQSTQTPDPKSVAWKDEEKYWIKCHYQLLLSAVTHHLCKAPEGTVACAYFNAYFQGYVSEPSKDRISQPIYPNRTFVEFREEVYRDHRRTFDQIIEKSLDNTKAGATMVFHPIVTPSILETYIKIQNEFAVTGQVDFLHPGGTSKLNNFIQDIVTEQLAPSEPTWIADGRANILRRPPLNMVDHTVHNPGELRKTDKHEVRSGDRDEWYKNSSTRNSPSDYTDISHSPSGSSQQLRIEYRNIHADSGNALLNMAILRPDGYDGDLKMLAREDKNVELPQMSAQQRRDFEENVRAVKVGDALRKQLFEEAGWPMKDKPTDETAAVQSEETD